MVEKKVGRIEIFPTTATMVGLIYFLSRTKDVQALVGVNAIVIRRKMFEILGAIFEFFLILFTGADFSSGGDKKK